jgi:hypothetical protein
VAGTPVSTLGTLPLLHLPAGQASLTRCMDPRGTCYPHSPWLLKTSLSRHLRPRHGMWGVTASSPCGSLKGGEGSSPPVRAEVAPPQPPHHGLEDPERLRVVGQVVHEGRRQLVDALTVADVHVVDRKELQQLPQPSLELAPCRRSLSREGG